MPYGARIEFLDGRGRVRASGRDLFEHENSEVRTPWYRIWLPESGEAVTTIRVTIGDRAGQETVAEYPLPVQDTTFYYVLFGVGTGRPSNGPTSGIDIVGTRTYPVSAGARRELTDSLIISYASRMRGCFRCIY